MEGLQKLVKERISEIEAGRDRYLTRAESFRVWVNDFGKIDSVDNFECMVIQLRECEKLFRKAKIQDDRAFEMRQVLGYCAERINGEGGE